MTPEFARTVEGEKPVTVRRPSVAGLVTPPAQNYTAVIAALISTGHRTLTPEPPVLLRTEQVEAIKRVAVGSELCGVWQDPRYAPSTLSPSARVHYFDQWRIAARIEMGVAVDEVYTLALNERLQPAGDASETAYYGVLITRDDQLFHRVLLLPSTNRGVAREIHNRLGYMLASALDFRRFSAEEIFEQGVSLVAEAQRLGYPESSRATVRVPDGEEIFVSRLLPLLPRGAVLSRDE